MHHYRLLYRKLRYRPVLDRRDAALPPRNHVMIASAVGSNLSEVLGRRLAGLIHEPEMTTPARRRVYRIALYIWGDELCTRKRSTMALHNTLDGRAGFSDAPRLWHGCLHRAESAGSALYSTGGGTAAAAIGNSQGPYAFSLQS